LVGTELYYGFENRIHQLINSILKALLKSKFIWTGITRRRYFLGRWPI